MDLHRRCERLIGRFRDGDIDRRSFLGLLGRASLLAGLAGPAVTMLARQAVAAESLRFDGWGGVAQQALTRHIFTPFTEQTGIAIRQGSFGGWEEFLTRVRASSPGEYNVCSLSNLVSYYTFIQGRLGQPLDLAKIPRLALFDQRGVEAFRRLSNGEICAVPYQLTTIGIAYNRDKLDGAALRAQGVQALLNDQYRGRLVGENNWLRRIWYAALQSGQDPNAIGNMDAVWDRIRASRRLVTKYWSSGAEQMSLLANGTADLSDAWGIRVFHLKKQGHPIDIFYPEGIYTDTAGMFVFKGTPLEPVYALFDIVLREEVQFALAEQEGSTPLFDPEKVTVPPELKASLPGYDENGRLRIGVFPDPVYWNANGDAWQRRYTQVMARG